MRVYEKVRAYIDEMGYKQVTIAEKAGIPKATFNAILNGKRTLYRISPVLSQSKISATPPTLNPGQEYIHQAETKARYKPSFPDQTSFSHRTIHHLNEECITVTRQSSLFSPR